MANIGSDFDLVEGIEDGLEILSNAMEVADAIPGVAAIAATARLIYSAMKTEKEFKAADRTTKTRFRSSRL